MFAAFPAISLPRANKVDPKDIPEPTPITLPHDQPRLHQPPSPSTAPSKPLVSYLQSISRPAEISPALFEALGVHVVPDATARHLLPDSAYLPDFAAWDGLSLDEARDREDSTKTTLNTGALSPGCSIYHERKRELSINNDDAFNVVRRQPPPKGKQPARLGNAYEFYRCLENLSMFWDDTSKPAPQKPPATEADATVPDSAASGTENAQDDAETNKQVPGDDADADADADAKGKEKPLITRTANGTSMPAEYRQGLVNAFIKLVAYDFTCNASAARAEPRLHIKAPLPPAVAKQNLAPDQLPSTNSSYFASACTFVWRAPRTREAARAGLQDGPVAAVSTRATITFADETDHSIDFARELVAALLTAQHRTRQGKKEKRPGEGKWWTTKPRWGGGTGGPIGREVERDAIQGDKDSTPKAAGPDSSSSSSSTSSKTTGGMPVTKRARKQMSIYDNYRMVRPPSSSWDPKARYEAIGKAYGSGYDDIFVISAVFHHVSILRVRVPEKLLEIFEGGPDEGGSRSWGEIEVKRSRWFDLFLVEDRLEAMKIIWGVMSWMMRKPEGSEQPETKKDGEQADVKMSGT